MAEKYNNIFPQFNSDEWVKYGRAASTISYDADNPYICTFESLSDDDRIEYTRSANPFSIYKLGFRSMSHDGTNASLYMDISCILKDGSRKLELSKKINTTALNDFSTEFQADGKAASIKIRFTRKTEPDQDPSVNITLADPYLYLKKDFASSPQEPIMPGVNLLPRLDGDAWCRQMLACQTAEYDLTDKNKAAWDASSQKDDFVFTVYSSNAAGKEFELGYEAFTASGNAKKIVRINSYDAEGNYTTVINKTAEPDSNYTYKAVMPADCRYLKFYIRRADPAAGQDDLVKLSVTNPYLKMTGTEPPPPPDPPIPPDPPPGGNILVLNKILKDNLPKAVEPGTEKIWYTLDGDVVQQYITAKDGRILPVTTPSTGYGDDYFSQYMQDAIDERKEEIKALTRAGHCIVFAQINDIHVRKEDPREFRYHLVRNYIMLSKQIPLNYICCCGDLLSYTEEWNGLYDTRLEKIRVILDKFRCPWFAIPGNHDNNADDSDDEISKLPTYNKDTAKDLCVNNYDWWKSMCYSNGGREDMDLVFDELHPTLNYYYVDDYNMKHRLVFLNTSETKENDLGQVLVDEAMTDRSDTQVDGLKTKHQLEWLFYKAMDMTGKTDWEVSFFPI